MVDLEEEMGEVEGMEGMGDPEEVMGETVVMEEQVVDQGEMEDQVDPGKQ